LNAILCGERPAAGHFLAMRSAYRTPAHPARRQLVGRATMSWSLAFRRGHASWTLYGVRTMCGVGAVPRCRSPASSMMKDADLGTCDEAAADLGICDAAGATAA
jgi:hypothetical protein